MQKGSLSTQDMDVDVEGGTDQHPESEAARPVARPRA